MSSVSPSNLAVGAWTVPKEGYHAEQNEDAYRIERFPGESGGERMLIALSDGATGAIYSRLWAQALTAAATPEWPRMAEEALRAELDQVRQTFSPFAPGKEIPWYARDKYRLQGSQATLLVVTVTPDVESDTCTVQALAVGDGCLFLFRAEGEICSFPASRAEEVGLDPTLLTTHPQPSLVCTRWEGRMQPGDLLLICTDAVEKWILQCLEAQQAGRVLDLLQNLVTSPLPQAETPETDFAEMECKASISMPAQNDLVERPEMAAPQEQPGVEETHPDSLWQRMLGWIFPPPNPSESAQTDSACPERPADAPEPAAFDFGRFISEQRQPQSAPRMRDDDSTLVLCIPVEPTLDQEQALRNVVRQLWSSATSGKIYRTLNRITVTE